MKNTQQLFGLIIYLLSELKHTKLVSVVSRYQLLQTDCGLAVSTGMMDSLWR